MAAQQQTVRTAEAALERARTETACVWRQLRSEQAAHAATAAAAAAAAAAATAALDSATAEFRRKLLASHMRELGNDIAHAAEVSQLRQSHAAELAAAVAAAKTAERQRLQAAVGPGLLLLEETGRNLRRRLESVEAEAADDRACVWDRLDAMPSAARNLFFQ